MENLLKNIWPYSIGIGAFLFIFFMFLFIKDMKKNRVSNMRVFLLPVLAITSIFGTIGTTVIINNIYKDLDNVKLLIVGIVCVTPFILTGIITVIVYLKAYIDDIKNNEK